MKATHRPRLLAVVLLGMAAVGLAACQDAAAYEPWGYYYGWPAYERSVYVGDSVPFYALHPPVYYSYPVARPYGYSPFAYPPGVRTPEVERPQPAVVQNPYVAGFVEGGPAASTAKVQPLRIVNPYAK